MPKDSNNSGPIQQAEAPIPAATAKNKDRFDDDEFGMAKSLLNDNIN